MTKSLFKNRNALRVALAGSAAAALLAGCVAGTVPGGSANSRTMSLQTLQGAVRPGMSEGDVVASIGRPTYWFPVGLQKQFVWNYRFAPPEGDCFVFQVSFANDSRRVSEVGQGYDRECDGPNRD